MSMKILITESQYNILMESKKKGIYIPIKVGDTVLGGRFKNKKIIVKSIGKDDKGQITINGKPLLKVKLID